MSNTRKDNVRHNHLEKTVSIFCTQRWILAYVGFFGFGVVYSLRVNLNVAVVCMLKTSNRTSMDTEHNVYESSCISQIAEASHLNESAELDWDYMTKSTIQASFYYGYIVTQIPGGWLADKYGGKRVFGYSVLASSVLTVLMPVCARNSVYLVYIIRVMLGLLTAVTFPAMHAMWGKWAPPSERTKLTTLCYAGTNLGNVVTYSSAGLLCVYGFDNGWGSIFYLTGISGMIWCGAWFYIVADTPTKHPRISKEEHGHITGSIEYKTDRKIKNVPWLAIVKSPCVWACLTTHTCNNWTNYTLLTQIPTFMKEVLKFDIKQNGALSVVPYICQSFGAIFAGQSADFVRSRKMLSTTNTRKIFQFVSFTGAGGCLIGTGFCGCNTRILAVALLSVACTFRGAARAGVLVNHVDFAPKYAGVLFGISNTVATVPGMTAPILAGYLTPNHTPEEWRNVFNVCSGVMTFGILIFSIFGSGEIQDWAKDEDIETEHDDKVTNSSETNGQVELVKRKQEQCELNNEQKDEGNILAGVMNKGFKQDSDLQNINNKSNNNK